VSRAVIAGMRTAVSQMRDAMGTVRG
jgi:pyridoxine 5'-phosphate synthase PdxJ